MPFCPSCRVEYRVGISQCSDCASELVETLPELPPEPLGLELAVLASFPTVSEAEMIQELLEGNGIATVLRGEVDPIGVSSRAAETTILVEEKDLERARELYEAFFAGEEGESEDLPVEPINDSGSG
jgi:hypothetical protein